MTDRVLQLDARGRVGLGRLGAHPGDRYLASRDEHGTITLTPVVVVPASDAPSPGA